MKMSIGAIAVSVGLALLVFATMAYSEQQLTEHEKPAEAAITTGLATALSMIERLPLSDVEKAEVVPRLL